jgi:hypothetical protein
VPVYVKLSGLKRRSIGKISEVFNLASFLFRMTQFQEYIGIRFELKGGLTIKNRGLDPCIPGLSQTRSE